MCVGVCGWVCAAQTLAVVLGGVAAKNFHGFAYDVIDVAVGIDRAEATLGVRPARPRALLRMCARLCGCMFMCFRSSLSLSLCTCVYVHGALCLWSLYVALCLSVYVYVHDALSFLVTANGSLPLYMHDACHCI
jgi:hypothetical protein